MPQRDGTGPMGQGPLTGRGFGPCEGTRPFGRGRGFGRGFGRGRCWQAMPFAQLTKEEETAELKREKELIEKRLKELEK